MSNKIVEGELFVSPFTRKVYKVKKIHVNSVLMEEVGNESRQLLTEKGTIGHFYEKVIEQHIPDFLVSPSGMVETPRLQAKRK